MSDLPWGGILLDIEGTTSAIDFVYQTMFPFVRRELTSFLETQTERPDVQAALDQIAAEAGWRLLPDVWNHPATRPANLQRVRDEVLRQMDVDAKSTGLKSLQGLIWEAGFQSGELVAEMYDDVLPALHHWRAQGIPVRIYSSGSIAAQQLFFGHTTRGDLRAYLDGHYDTTIGGKRDADSYRRIATDWGLSPPRILFVSDVGDELAAAATAGLHVALAIRPGNPPQANPNRWLQIQSFQELPLGPGA